MFYAAEGNSGFFHRADSSYPADGRCTCDVDLIEDEWELLDLELDTSEELLTPGLAVYRAESPDILEPVGEPLGQDFKFRQVKCNKPVEFRVNVVSPGGYTHFTCEDHADLICMFLMMDAMSTRLPVEQTRQFAGESVEAVQAAVVQADRVMGTDGYVRTGYRWELHAPKPTISTSYVRPVPTD